MTKVVSKSIELAGRTLTLEYGRLAAQATSAVLARYGDTMVLATVVMGKEDRSKDYFPLSVEYQERLYSGGRIKGSRWVKRERGTDEEILSGRLIDRSIRPLFPKTFKNEVQVVVTVLSTDVENDADVLGIVATSAALAVSPIPWLGPLGAVRVGLEEGQLVVNPKNGNRSGVALDLVISSTDKVIPMIEAGAGQIPEERILAALETGFAANKQIIKLIDDLVAEVGKDKIVLAPVEPDSHLVAQVTKVARPRLEEWLPTAAGKEGGDLQGIITTASEGLEDRQKADVPAIVESVLHQLIRTNIKDKSKRPDGRKLDEIRPLEVQVGVLPRVHGSAIFQRGQTQALTVATLGSPSLSQTLETAEGESVRRYMHHYNFPPYSTGETGRVGAPKRREIGHGALAERALEPVIPAEADFPYAIRVVSEIMSSNGSTSMASTCGSTLALMDAGVPIKSPVAGISIGLVDDVLLTDIIGLEDHHGDMDFKVAGTKDGITAIQLDTKVYGLTLAICEQVFARAKAARLQILDKMLSVLPEPRKELSQYAPKIFNVQIPVEKIGELIGPGGKNIKKLMSETQTIIDVNDAGMVFVSGADPEGVGHIVTYLQNMSREVVPGEILEGTVVRLQPFGAFVNVLPGKDGLVHVSQMAQGFVADPAQVVQEGQVVKVWVTEVTPEGKIGLSMLFDAAGKPMPKAREERPRDARPPMRSHDRFGDRRGGRDHFRAPRRRF